MANHGFAVASLQSQNPEFFERGGSIIPFIPGEAPAATQARHDAFLGISPGGNVPSTDPNFVGPLPAGQLDVRTGAPGDPTSGAFQPIGLNDKLKALFNEGGSFPAGAGGGGVAEALGGGGGSGVATGPSAPSPRAGIRVGTPRALGSAGDQMLLLRALLFGNQNDGRSR